MLITNLWTKIRLVNESIGTISNISWDLNQNLTSNLSTRVLIRFNNYKGPDFPDCPPSIILVFTIT
jgi:hypothetical protein